MTSFMFVYMLPLVLCWMGILWYVLNHRMRSQLIPTILVALGSFVPFVNVVLVIIGFTAVVCHLIDKEYDFEDLSADWKRFVTWASSLMKKEVK